MPLTIPAPYDTEQDSVGLTSPPPAVEPPTSAAPAVLPPSTPWSTIEAASNQISAGQPVTALPRQTWTFPEQQAFNAKLDAYDQQAKAARQAAEQSAMDAQMYAQMSRVAKSTKDIEIAKRSIDVMGLQRDIQSGVPIHEAVARHPMALGSGFGSTLKATAPVPAPTVVAPSGKTPGYIQDPRGVPHFFPASSMEHPLDTSGTVLKDPESGKRIGAVYRTGPNTQHIVMDKVPGNVKPSTANAIYGSQERALMKELGDIEARAALINPKNPKYEYYKGLQDQLKAVRENRAALITAPDVPPSTKPATNAAPARRVVRNPKTGKLEIQ